MSRRIRILIGVLLLTISFALLVWGFAPTRREIRTQPIAPNELQLPTPETFLFPFEAFL